MLWTVIARPMFEFYSIRTNVIIYQLTISLACQTKKTETPMATTAVNPRTTTNDEAPVYPFSRQTANESLSLSRKPPAQPRA